MLRFVFVSLMVGRLLAGCTDQPEPLEPLTLEIPSEILSGPFVIQVVQQATIDDIFEFTMDGDTDGNLKIYCKNGKVEVSVLKGGNWILLFMGETANCNPSTMLDFVLQHERRMTELMVQMGFTGVEINNMVRLLGWYIDNKKE